MARPTRLSLVSGISAWDAIIDANFALVFDAPFALYQVSVVGSLPAASSYDQCLALVGSELYISDGASWSKYLGTAAAVADSTATTVSEMVTDFNELLTSLRDAGIMAGS